jgi:hypothetical protein
MPALSWYDDQQDKELLRLANLLERLAHENDVRNVIKSLILHNSIDPVAEQIYLSKTMKHKRENTVVRTSNPINKPTE